MKYKSKTLLFLLFIASSLSAQQYRAPLDIPLFLSGNFGELRNNHFHSGIDFKTQAVINKPVYAIEDGFVSRINISSSGYGLAIYVDHPKTGHTSVCAHIHKFPKKIADYIKEEQYKQESFKVDLILDENQFPIKKGDLIAYSGNSGSSGGPHVHFEIRDTESENILDPLVFYKSRITDKVAPDLRGIAIYPTIGEGVVNGKRSPLRIDIKKNKKGQTTSLPSITAWGKISFGVKAYDKMTSTNNVYGVKIVRLYVDGELIFKSDIESFSFANTRMLNSFVDFEDWRNRKSFYMRSFVEPGNTLPFYETKNDGYLEINEERTYNIKYELEDLYGNITPYGFSVEGKKQEIPGEPRCTQHMSWKFENQFIRPDFSLIIEAGNLYSDVCFNFEQTLSKSHYANIYTVNSTPIPLHRKGSLRIEVKNDTIQNKRQYGIVQINGNGDLWVGGIYNQGFISTNINELGKKYSVSIDSIPPQIISVNEKIWTNQKTIKIKLTDDFSGIESFRGEIDRKFVLFTHDVKSSVYTYTFDDRLVEGQKHLLTFKATDRCGNISEYSTEFVY